MPLDLGAIEFFGVYYGRQHLQTMESFEKQSVAAKCLLRGIIPLRLWLVQRLNEGGGSCFRSYLLDIVQPSIVHTSIEVFV